MRTKATTLIALWLFLSAFAPPLGGASADRITLSQKSLRTTAFLERKSPRQAAINFLKEDGICILVDPSLPESDAQKIIKAVINANQPGIAVGIGLPDNNIPAALGLIKYAREYKEGINNTSTIIAVNNESRRFQNVRRAVEEGASLVIIEKDYIVSTGEKDIGFLCHCGAAVIMNTRVVDEVKTFGADAIGITSLDEKAIADIRKTAPDMPIVARVNLPDSVAVSYLREGHRGWGAAVAINDIKTANSLIWYLTATAEEISLPLQIIEPYQDLPGQPPVPQETIRQWLDYFIPRLLKKDPGACIKLLGNGVPREAALCLIGYLAAPEAIMPIYWNKYGDFLGLMNAAKTNEDPAISAIPQAIEDMVNQINNGTFAGFELPTALEPGGERLSAFARKEMLATGCELKDTVATSAPTILHQHTNARQIIICKEGEIIILRGPQDRSVALRAYHLKKGMLMPIEPGEFHMVINKTRDAEILVFNEDPSNSGKTVAPETNLACMGGIFKWYQVTPQYFLESGGVLAVIESSSWNAKERVKSIIDAYCPVAIELTFIDDGSRRTQETGMQEMLELIRFARHCKRQVGNTSTLIAAGPILNADAALKAVSAGARLIVTPELNLGAADIEHIHKKGARVIMPASSVQEAQEAKERRADAITVFSSWPKQGGPCKALEISEAVGNTPVIVTGNKVIDLIHKDQRWGAEVAIQDGQDERSVKELLWFFSVSPDALSEAENIGDLLEKMASDEVALSELDGLVITLINKKPEAYKELLMAGSPREVASWLIGYLAVPEIAKPAASAGHLEGFLTEALLNSDINKIAAAVAHMNVAIMTGAFTGFELPTQIAAKPVQKERDLRLESLINQQGNLEFPSYCWRTAILEQHPNTREHLMVLKGKVVVLSCPSPGKDLTAVALGKGDIITVPPGQYHIAVSMTAGAQVRSCYDDPVIEWRPVLPKTEFRCIGAVFDVRNYHPETPILPDPVLSAV